ncbi:GrpB family protein [Streptomyces bathyalis]|uniref:GrpB family protein n=1 Tax=Streptomyces bathyalis TaxID=2710756 RepID=A0A7T1WUY2_9ACTN|nr:GrpB family protein [Streptomyces bathyalis]QPP08395.1 GrpB family protein [Streptomyces bathyalis]
MPDPAAEPVIGLTASVATLDDVTAGTWDTRNERLFRDHMRSHPQVAREYGELNQRATGEGADGPAYGKRRTELIRRVVDHERAVRDLRLVLVREE